MATRQVLRIFISSTAIDLRDYRERVRDAVLRLEDLPIAMETFSASGGEPATESMRMAAEAHLVFCLVAHRYGYVPPPDLGGDGDPSITWLEVDAAKRAGKPVFAFLIHPNAAWTGLKEQDRLVSDRCFRQTVNYAPGPAHGSWIRVPLLDRRAGALLRPSLPPRS